jgi:hypothetical protein
MYLSVHPVHFFVIPYVTGFPYLGIYLPKAVIKCGHLPYALYHLAIISLVNIIEIGLVDFQQSARPSYA